MNEQDENTTKTVLKGVLNILTAVLCGAVAILFAVYGYTYKSIDFISRHFDLLVWLTVSVIVLLLILYLVFYLLKKQAYYRSILCALVCLDIFAVLFFVACSTDMISKVNSIESLRDYIDSFGSLAVILFILFQFLQVVILPVPGSVSVAAGVALFGPLRCTLYSFIGIFLGSIVAFAVGRVAGYKVVCWIVGKDDLDKWLNKVKGKDYLILSLMFLLPMFPDDILCFVAGLSSMSWGYFIIMIAITRAISVSTTAYSLQFIPFNTWWGILIWILIALIVALLFYLVLKYSERIDAFIKKKFKINRRKKK
jgi:uncharacterized membrane protein YdjX (TVP38/TMEM64 family)